MPRITAEKVQGKYDLILVGSGFGSLFFLHNYRRRFPRARVLILEWGSYLDANWQRQNAKNSDIDTETTYSRDPSEKMWNYNIGFGGGTNCWWAQTPRMSETDLKLYSTYGVGADWPLTYDEIEPYYCDAEDIMQIAGPNELTRRYPRSRPFPQAPHHISSADKLMMAAMPDSHFAAPCARLRTPQGARAACCATSRCNLCPVEAKFTALNSMSALYENDTVDVCCNARVRQVETAAGIATGVMFEADGVEHRVAGEVIGLGANGIQTPFILLQSGFKHPVLGRYLHEKRIAVLEVRLDGLDHFDGGVPITGMNLSMMDGVHRSNAAASMVYVVNEWRHGLRTEYGRWRQTMPIELMIEDLPQLENGVFDEGGDYPVIRHAARSDYCERGLEHALSQLPELLSALPVEEIIRRDDVPTGSHVQGTCRMGVDPEQSFVDKNLICHQVRNLLILGTAVWPSCSPVNPSLTAAAIALRAADKLGR